MSPGSDGCCPLLYEMVGNSHLPPSLVNICYSKYFDISSLKVCEKMRLSAGTCLRSCIRSCCSFLLLGTRGVFDQRRPNSSLVWVIAFGCSTTQKTVPREWALAPGEGERAGSCSSCFKTRCRPKRTRKLLGSFLTPKLIKEFSTAAEVVSWWFGAFSLHWNMPEYVNNKFTANNVKKR